MASTNNITAFAKTLATAARKSLEGSLPYHTQYVKADTAVQKDMRAAWMLGHVQGTLGVSAIAVEIILSEGKKAGAAPEHVKAIDRATSDFRYHVIRPEGKGVATSDELQVPKSIQVLADALALACAEYEGARKLAATALAKSFAA